MDRVLRIEVLVDRRDLQSAQTEHVDVVFELFDGVFVVRIDGTPADESVRVFRNEAGDELLGHVHPAVGRLQSEHHHPVAVFGRLQQRFGRGIEGILVLVLVAGVVHVLGQPHLGLLGGVGEFHELIGHMVRVPHQVGMDVD